MNSRISMVLAGLLLIGALIAGYWGLVLSRAPEPVAVPAAPVVSVEKTIAAAEDQTRQPVVVLVHDVPAYRALTAARAWRRHLAHRRQLYRRRPARSHDSPRRACTGGGRG